MVTVSRKARRTAAFATVLGLWGCGDAPAPVEPPRATPERTSPSQAIAEPAPVVAPAPAPSAQDVFWQRLSALCGQAFSGYLTVGTEESDRTFGESDMTMHVRDCTDAEIRIPFAVGDNRSRTWVIRRTDGGLSLRHRHVDENGRSAAPDNYGGVTANEGSTVRQEFVVDDQTQAQLPETRYNVWAIEVAPGKTFAYELQRPEEERFFRIEFDLDQPIETPPAPWSDAGES